MDSSRDLLAEKLLNDFCKAYDDFMEDEDDSGSRVFSIRADAKIAGYEIIEDDDVAELWYIFKDNRLVCAKHTKDEHCSYSWAGMTRGE